MQFLTACSPVLAQIMSSYMINMIFFYWAAAQSTEWPWNLFKTLIVNHCVLAPVSSPFLNRFFFGSSVSFTFCEIFMLHYLLSCNPDGFMRANLGIIRYIRCTIDNISQSVVNTFREQPCKPSSNSDSTSRRDFKNLKKWTFQPVPFLVLMKLGLPEGVLHFLTTNGLPVRPREW